MKDINFNNDVCDEITFKKLFQSLGKQLFKFLYLKYQNEEFAREGMQEAFITLWNNCKKVPESKAKNYVFTVGRNRVVDILRRNKKNLRISKDEFFVEEEHANDIDENKKRKINYILSIMPQASKEAFLMNRVQGLKYAEIAEELDISIKAVEKRMSKALEIIKNELNKGRVF